jgi:hypothetical protein
MRKRQHAFALLNAKQLTRYELLLLAESSALSLSSETVSLRAV